MELRIELTSQVRLLKIRVLGSLADSFFIEKLHIHPISARPKRCKVALTRGRWFSSPRGPFWPVNRRGPFAGVWSEPPGRILPVHFPPPPPPAGLLPQKPSAASRGCSIRPEPSGCSLELPLLFRSALSQLRPCLCAQGLSSFLLLSTLCLVPPPESTCWAQPPSVPQAARRASPLQEPVPPPRADAGRASAGPPVPSFSSLLSARSGGSGRWGASADLLVASRTESGCLSRSA